MNRLKLYQVLCLFLAYCIFFLRSSARSLDGLPCTHQERYDYENGAYFSIFTTEIRKSDWKVVLQMNETDGRINYFARWKREISNTCSKAPAETVPSDDRPDEDDFDYKK